MVPAPHSRYRSTHSALLIEIPILIYCDIDCTAQVFYEGSVHVPLIMRLPGVIPAGRVVEDPVSNLALFGTFVDYLGLPAELVPTTSKSLRPLIEGSDTDENTERVIFSFWDSDISPVSHFSSSNRTALCINTTSG